jgi:hypothetical protein
MLKEVEAYFDHYTINARLMPAFLTTLPIASSIFAWCAGCKVFAGAIFSLLVCFGAMSLLSLLMSYFGNNTQDRLILKWGGLPTTILLRHSDTTIDKYTKSRVHHWITNRIDDLHLPNREQEAADPIDADEKYQSATHYLREETRNKTEHPKVYRDNVAYGFARNLLAIRVFGLLISGLCMTFNAFYFYATNSLVPITGNFNISNVLGIVALLVSISSFLVFSFFVTDSLVKARAVRYAKSLFEACVKDS